MEKVQYNDMGPHHDSEVAYIVHKNHDDQALLFMPGDDDSEASLAICVYNHIHKYWEPITEDEMYLYILTDEQKQQYLSKIT